MTCSVETHDYVPSYLAAEAGVIAINVEYRLAPEYKFPRGLEDCYLACKWAIEHKEKLLKKKAYLDYIRENGQYIEKQRAARDIVVYKFIELVSFDSKTRIALSIRNDSDQNGNYYTYPCSDVVEVYGMLVEKLSEIVNLDLTCLSSFNEQAVGLALRELSTDGALNTEEIKRKKYYFISK